MFPAVKSVGLGGRTGQNTGGSRQPSWVRTPDTRRAKSWINYGRGVSYDAVSRQLTSRPDDLPPLFTLPYKFLGSTISSTSGTPGTGEKARGKDQVFFRQYNISPQGVWDHTNLFLMVC